MEGLAFGGEAGGRRGAVLIELMGAREWQEGNETEDVNNAEGKALDDVLGRRGSEGR